MTTTDQQAAFLRSICEEPHNLGYRQMYADWLEARGDARGEFILVQLELEKPCKLGYSDRYHVDSVCTACDPLWNRQQELLGKYQGVWTIQMLDRLPDIHRSPLLQAAARDATRVGSWPSDDSMFRFRRGFVERVKCRMQDWLDHGPAMVLAAPITEVRIVDREPYHNAAGVWLWIRDHQGYSALVTHNEGVPPEIFDHLDGGGSDLRTRFWIRFYGTAELAHADLSRAAVAMGEGQGGVA